MFASVRPIQPFVRRRPKATTERLSAVRHKVQVLSGKGCVGKSTTTKELGFAWGHLNITVGLVDTDICGPSLSRVTEVRAEEVHNSASGWEPVSVDDNVSVIHFLLPNTNDAVVWRGPPKNGMIKNFLKDVARGDLDVMTHRPAPEYGFPFLGKVPLDARLMRASEKGSAVA